MPRDPRRDPQAGDILYLGNALRRRVLEVAATSVAWELTDGPEAGQRRVSSLSHWRRLPQRAEPLPEERDAKPQDTPAAAADPLGALPSRQQRPARAYLAACEQLAGADGCVRAPERDRLKKSGLSRSAAQRAEAALVAAGWLEVVFRGEHVSATRVLRLRDPGTQAAREPARLTARSRRPPARQPARGFVYFFRLGDHVKIGWSLNVERRVAAFQKFLPGEVTLLGALPGDQTLERSIHRVLQPLRTRGEWFRADPTLLAVVALLLGAA